MNTKATLAFLSLPSINPGLVFHEHTAIHTTSARDVRGALDVYSSLLGYDIDLRNENVGFAWRGQHRLEILRADGPAPEHEAFAVEELADFEPIVSAIDATRDLFEIVSADRSKEDFRNLLFRHLPTGAFLQVVWREKPLFPDVFKK
jgi:hypothetical protein